MNWTNPGLQDGPIAVTVSNQSVLLDDLRQKLLEGAGFSVATLNLDHVVKLARDPAFRAAYVAHTHVTADDWGSLGYGYGYSKKPTAKTT